MNFFRNIIEKVRLKKDKYMDIANNTDIQRYNGKAILKYKMNGDYGETVVPESHEGLRGFSTKGIRRFVKKVGGWPGIFSYINYSNTLDTLRIRCCNEADVLLHRDI